MPIVQIVVVVAMRYAQVAARLTMDMVVLSVSVVLCQYALLPLKSLPLARVASSRCLGTCAPVTTRLVESGLDYDTVGLITGHRAKELITHYSHKHHGSVARVAATLEQTSARREKSDENGQDLDGNKLSH
jgi:hypothetical protein